MISGGFSRGNPPAHWHSIDTMNNGLTAPLTAFSSTVAWPTANLAIYVPVMVRQNATVKQLWYANNTTATGNFDIGLYDAAGAALLRKGSTAKSTTGAEIVWDCTDTVISSGLYYLALANDTNTDTFFGITPAAPYLAAIGLYTEASAFALPATATFAIPQALAFCPVIGMYLDTRVT
jgi:hypothetical protein